MRVLITIIVTIMWLGACRAAPVKTTDSPEIVKTAGISLITPAEARPAVEAAYSQFVDVRTPEEYAEEHAYRARNIPLDTLAQNLDKLEKNEPVYLICRTDNRSQQAAEILVNAGFKQAIVVKGGTVAWKEAGLPMAGPQSQTSSSKLDDPTRKALLSALADERRAEAMYQAVLRKFPGSRPFVNIIEAEKHHQGLLLPLFEKYEVATPPNEFDPSKLEVASTLTEACNDGVKAEKENIALYDGFLEFVREADIKDVFVRLQAASRDNHLPAFARCAEGRGAGRGRGGPN